MEEWQKILLYLEHHPMTFNIYKRTKPLKPMGGIPYNGGAYHLIYKWGNYYVTKGIVTYAINKDIYNALATGKHQTVQEGIFVFTKGFELCVEGKLLLASMERMLTQKEVFQVKELFELGFVHTYVTNYLKLRSQTKMEE